MVPGDSIRQRNAVRKSCGFVSDQTSIPARPPFWPDQELFYEVDFYTFLNAHSPQSN
jgi:hypothetical protein